MHSSMSSGSYYHNAQCILFVYDLTSQTTLDYLADEFTMVKKNKFCPADTRFILVRNKADIQGRRVSVTHDGEWDFLENHKEFKNSLHHILETSAAEDTGIYELFGSTIPKALQKVEGVEKTDGATDMFSKHYEKNGGKDDGNSGCC